MKSTLVNVKCEIWLKVIVKLEQIEWWKVKGRKELYYVYKVNFKQRGQFVKFKFFVKNLIGITENRVSTKFHKSINCVKIYSNYV